MFYRDAVIILKNKHWNPKKFRVKTFNIGCQQHVPRISTGNWLNAHIDHTRHFSVSFCNVQDSVMLSEMVTNNSARMTLVPFFNINSGETCCWITASVSIPLYSIDSVCLCHGLQVRQTSISFTVKTTIQTKEQQKTEERRMNRTWREGNVGLPYARVLIAKHFPPPPTHA